MTCGIYRVRNRMTGMIYIGSSNNIERRWQYEHLRDLRNDTYRHRDGTRPLWQEEWNTYGSTVFECLVQETCSTEDLFILEQQYLDTLQPFEDLHRGYNNNRRAEAPPSQLGRRQSEETRRTRSETLKLTGHKPPSGARKGMKNSEEHRKKLSEAHLRRSHESAARIREGRWGKRNDED